MIDWLECVLKAIEDNVCILLNWFDQNLFKVNADKCHLLVPKSSIEISLNIKNDKVINEKSIKLLGATMDIKLDFNEHMSKLCKKASQKWHALARVAPYIDSEKLKILLKGFIESQFDYCPLIWMFHNRTMNNRINKLHERALRIAYKDNELTFKQLLTKDNSFTVHERNLQRLATEIYKAKITLIHEKFI